MVLPKSMRLKGYKSFEHLHSEGNRYHTNSMMIKVAKESLINKQKKQGLSYKDSIKIAVAISNKVSKKSVTRNKFRRLLHTHLKVKLLDKKNLSSKWALLILKPSCSRKNNQELIHECDRLLIKAGLC
tara:strand:+ start:21770 stop:22153 length:384 start_codon:yes stop_codon:yes gene_type:complete